MAQVFEVATARLAETMASPLAMPSTAVGCVVPSIATWRCSATRYAASATSGPIDRTAPIARFDADPGCANPHSRGSTDARRPNPHASGDAGARRANSDPGGNTDARRPNPGSRHGSGWTRHTTCWHADRFAIDDSTGWRSKQQ
jgi:hypothetical protein